MRLAIVSRDPARLRKHLGTIRRYRASLSKRPEIVIALGGDGTFLAAERIFPAVPKLLVREQSICNKCDWDNLDEGIKRLLAGAFTVQAFGKLRVRADGRTLEAVNDVVLRNASPTEAIRFTLQVNGKRIGGEWIGDGIVVATAFGSEGYFRSITRQHFEEGIGLALNNTTRAHGPLLLDAQARIVVRLTRGQAHVAVDNHPELLVLREGGRLTITTSRDAARIVRLR